MTPEQINDALAIVAEAAEKGLIECRHKDATTWFISNRVFDQQRDYKYRAKPGPREFWVQYKFDIGSGHHGHRRIEIYDDMSGEDGWIKVREILDE